MTYKKIICVIAIGVFFSGCAAVREVKQVGGQELVSVPTSKKGMMQLAGKYEKERNFKKALNALKNAQRLDPSDLELQARVKKLESGLDEAVRQQLKLAKRYFDQRELGKSKKEFLLLLFLDPEHHEALRFLKRLAHVSLPKTYTRAEEQVPGVKKDGYYLHILRPGESLSILAKKYYGDKMKYQIIADYNNIKDINRLSVGESIKVPIIGVMKPVKKKQAKSEPERMLIKKPEKPGPVKNEIVESGAIKPGEATKEDDGEYDYTKEALPGEGEKSEEQKIASLNYKSLEIAFKEAEELYLEENYIDALDQYQKVLHIDSDHQSATDWVKTIKQIIASLKNGDNLYMSSNYGMAYDEFSKVLSLNPDSKTAKDKIDKLITPMFTKAQYLLYDEQSPCEAIVIIEKILKWDTGNEYAEDLLDEAVAIEEGLELDCGSN